MESMLAIMMMLTPPTIKMTTEMNWARLKSENASALSCR
jgi:hypothetical protein